MQYSPRFLAERHLAAARAKTLHAIDELDRSIGELKDDAVIETPRHPARIHLCTALDMLGGTVPLPPRRDRRLELRALLERDDLTRAQLIEATHKLYKED